MKQLRDTRTDIMLRLPISVVEYLQNKARLQAVEESRSVTAQDVIRDMIYDSIPEMSGKDVDHLIRHSRTMRGKKAEGGTYQTRAFDDTQSRGEVRNHNQTTKGNK